MKKFIFLFLLLPLFSFGQYGLKNCHTDVVFGFDYGDRMIYSNQQKHIDFFEMEKTTTSPMYSYRFGMNVNYPISDNVYLVPGFRLVARNTESLLWIPSDIVGIPDGFVQKNQTHFYAEIPFSTRYIFKRLSRDSRLYVEGGLQFNIYAATFSKYKSASSLLQSVVVTGNSLERLDDHFIVNLAGGFAIGFESDIKPNLTFFVQPIVRHQFTPSEHQSPIRFYHFGLETGFRF